MSKGLQALEHMNKNIILCEDIDEDVEIIKKELQALELIKEKNVDADFFKYCCQEFSDVVALQQYNVRHVECSNNGKKLTGEEYDLLKEVLL